jgi:hypothetical protein
VRLSWWAVPRVRQAQANKTEDTVKEKWAVIEEF